jgi:hypothetical protein
MESFSELGTVLADSFCPDEGGDLEDGIRQSNDIFI